MSAPWAPPGAMPPWSMDDAMAHMNHQLAQANHQMNSALEGARIEIDKANAAMEHAFGPAAVPPAPIVPPPPMVHMVPPPPVLISAGPIPYCGPPTYPAPQWACLGRPALAPPPRPLHQRAHSSPIISSASQHGAWGVPPAPTTSSPPILPRSIPSTPRTPQRQQTSTRDLPPTAELRKDEIDRDSSPTPPPPAYDSWSFVGERFQTSRDSRSQLPQTPGSPSDAEQRPRRARRRRAAPSTQALIMTFHRYGAPSTVAQMSWDDDTAVASKPDLNREAATPGSHSGPETLYDLGEDAPVVLRGEKPEDDVFCSPPGDVRKMRRPTTWRPDYHGSPRIASFLPMLLRHASISKGGNDMPSTKNRSLTGLINWKRHHGNGLAYDLRSPETGLDRELFEVDVVTSPPAAWMRLYHRDLPWYIDVEGSTPKGITLLDVVRQMYKQLIIPLTERDVWNEDVSEEIRKCVAQGPRRRVSKGKKGHEPLTLGGPNPLRLDFLGHDFIFEGLVKGSNGMWEIKTRDWRA